MSRIHFFTALSLIAVGISGCNGNSDSSLRNNKPCVYTFKPKHYDGKSSVTHTAAVEEGKSVSVGFKTGGQITRLTVNAGDCVTKGQIIGFIDDVDYKLAVKQLEAQHNQLSSEVKRLDQMYQHNNIAPNDYEKAVAGLEQLETQLEMTKNKLAYTRLEAPVSGYVVERFMEEGEMAGAGTPIYKIIDNSSLETSVALPAAVYSDRKKITHCFGKSTITGNTEIPLDIIGFVPDADNNSLIRLRLRIPDSFRLQLLPGMNISVTLNYDSTDGSGQCLIPSRALFERNGKEYVWFVNQSDSTLSACEVSSVGSLSGSYSVINGLNEGAEIVAVGVHHLSENQKVQVIGDIANLKEKAAL